MTAWNLTMKSGAFLPSFFACHPCLFGCHLSMPNPAFITLRPLRVETEWQSANSTGLNIGAQKSRIDVFRRGFWSIRNHTTSTAPVRIDKISFRCEVGDARRSAAPSCISSRRWQWTSATTANRPPLIVVKCIGPPSESGNRWTGWNFTIHRP